MEIIDERGIDEQDYKRWDELLLDYIKGLVVIGITVDLEDDLKELNNLGFDMGIIKEGIDRVYQ